MAESAFSHSLYETVASRPWTSRCQLTSPARSTCCWFPVTRASTRPSGRSPGAARPSACPARPAVLAGVAGVAGAARSDSRGRLRAEVAEHPDASVDGRTRELEREYRATVEEILEYCGDDGRIAAFVRAIAEPGALADTSGYSPDLTFEQKAPPAETLDVTERLGLALEYQRERLAELQVRRRILVEDVESGAAKQQREYVLRKQMESIRRELGEDDGSIVDEYRTTIDDAGMPDDVREQAERKLGGSSARAKAAASATIRTYLDWLVAVPWSRRSDERLDPQHARRSTPTTSASTTSRTASPSTSPSRSCAPSAGSPRTVAPARSSR